MLIIYDILRFVMREFTISEVAKSKKKDRSTVQKWIQNKMFPNARLETSPFGSYWLIPESDLINFKEPKNGRPKKKKDKK